MGWSCSAVAGEVMDKWTKACLANSNMQNEWTLKGKTYFWEVSRKEHNDGAITGTILQVVSRSEDCSRANIVGSFRISGDGTIARAPKFLKDCVTIEGRLNQKLQAVSCALNTLKG